MPDEANNPSQVQPSSPTRPPPTQPPPTISNDDWNSGIKDTLHEVFKVIVEHDGMARDWMRMLLTIEAAVVAAIWTVLSLSNNIPYYRVLVLLIWLFGVCTLASLLAAIRRLKVWQLWFVRVVQRLQKYAPFFLSEHIQVYPTDGSEDYQTNKLPAKPGRIYYAMLWPCVAFVAVLTVALAALLFSPIQDKSKHGSIIHLQVGTNEFEVTPNFVIKQLTKTNAPAAPTRGRTIGSASPATNAP